MSSLSGFYEGKTILLTGATGFLGKVILEKICRSLPVVSKIYIGVTPKAGAGPNPEYQRFKQEILDSQIFDRLKLQLGLRFFQKLVEDKLVPIPFDLMRADLCLSDKLKGQLCNEVNIIIHAAALIDLKGKLDTAVRVNVTGPLKLLELAQQSHRIEAFVQVSTCFVNSDRTGYIEEKMYKKKGTNWLNDYEKIKQMTQLQLNSEVALQMSKDFPDAYTYSKRMAEELLAL